MLSNSEKRAPSQYVDFVLMRDVYHCTPQEFDEIPNKTVELHREFLNLEGKRDKIAMKRSEQAAKKR